MMFKDHMDSNVEFLGVQPLKNLTSSTNEVQIEFDHNYDDDVLRNGSSSDEEDNNRHFPEFNTQTYMRDPKFDVGMLFSYADNFRKAVKECIIIEQRMIKFKKNYSDKFKAYVPTSNVNGLNMLQCREFQGLFKLKL